MKKRSLRTYLFMVLVVFSFASFVYTNTVSVEGARKSQCTKHLMVTPEDEQESTTDLPEVQIVKQLIEKGRRLLPSTRL